MIPEPHRFPESDERPEWQRRRDDAAALVGETEVSPAHAWFAATALALVILVVPVVHVVRGGVGEALSSAAAGLGDAVSQLPSDPFAANTTATATLAALEDELEEESPLVTELLPATRLFGLAYLGIGSRDVVPGADGFLFWRPDLEVVLAPDPLAPAALARAKRRGIPDRGPLPAILALRDELAAREITLVMALAPVKPELEVARLVGRQEAAGSVATMRIAGFERFAAALGAAGIELVDPTPELAALSAGKVADSGTSAFLRSDTHWSPWAVELAADQIAARVIEVAPELASPELELRTQRRRVTGDGDLLRLLRLPAGVAGLGEVVEVEALVDPAAAVGRGGGVLLLGDSFAGVYARPELGWGRGAGLAEQLAVRLGRRVDLVAVNAGGARGSRERLAAELATQPDRLDGVRVVVWQLAARELLLGEWPVIALGSPGG